jgi:hypothetical protein
LLRRIRDHPELTLSSPGHSSYPDIVTSKGDTLTKLVSEWADEWLEDTRHDADIEKRLEGMVEEVVWSNVIWFGPGARENSSRPFNADFFVCVLSFLHGIAVLTLLQCSSCNIINLLAHRRPSL